MTRKKRRLNIGGEQSNLCATPRSFLGNLDSLSTAGTIPEETNWVKRLASATRSDDDSLTEELAARSKNASELSSDIFRLAHSPGARIPRS